jgi:succinyl-diaminopimelate desuccinylase
MIRKRLMTESLRDELVTLTTDLVRFRSTADQPDQLAAAIEYIADYLAHIPDLFVHRSESGGKPAIVATLHDTQTPALMLNGHIDVVAARPEQFEPQVRDGRIYGRATQDMKGSVAVFMRLLKTLAAQNPRPDVGFQFVSDEEIGGKHGTGRLLAEGWRCGFFIAAEPTDMGICYEQKGGLWVTLHLSGASAHGSRPWEGKNPIYVLNTALSALAQRFPPPAQEAWQTTVTPTQVQSAEGSHNQIPASLKLALDIRHTSDDTPDALLQALHACFPDADLQAREHVDPLNTDPDTPALRTLAQVTEELRGQPTPIYREHFSSDARFYSTAGIPAVCFGPVGKGLHSDEEWVEIDGLVQFYEVLHEYTRRTG